MTGTLVMLSLVLLSSAQAFQASISRRHTPLAPLKVHNLRDADLMEMMVGGERYEMISLPDSMVDTTLFVGNINEFVHDEDLSSFFQTVSTLQSLPACVARRANMASLHYGFVTFPTVEEKEHAIMRFHGCTFMDRTIKVEAIRDHPKRGRVKVPERMVSYVMGAAKKTRDGRENTMRRIASLEENEEKKKNPQRKKKQKKKAKNITFKLSESEDQELQRSTRKGFVTLNGTGYRRGRKTNQLACAHRQWCDEREKPQLVLCKASGGRALDCVIVDLSPLRTTNAIGSDLVNAFLDQRKSEILTAADNAGMELRSDYLEDNCETLSIDDEKCDVEAFMESTIAITNADSWATEPISKLPVLSMGVFEGGRANAKAMVHELALLWVIHEVPAKTHQDEFNSKRKPKRSKKDDNRRRRRYEKNDLFF